MKLYFFPVAPNPTKVRAYLAEKGIEIEQVLVNLPQGEQKAPEFLAKNPLGVLPTLELDDGTWVSESLAIMEYLEELHPEPPMIGTTPEERFRVRAIERTIDLHILVSAANIVHATRSPLGHPPRPEMADYFRTRLDRALPVVDATIGEGPFVCGERTTIADCSLFAACGFAAFGQVELGEQYTNIARWRDRFAERPGGQIPVAP